VAKFEIICLLIYNNLIILIKTETKNGNIMLDNVHSLNYSRRII